MPEKIIDYNKSEINMSPNKEWKDIEGTEFLELLTSGAELDAELYELAVKKVPQLVKQSKLVLKSSHKTMKQTMKSSKRTKKYYYKLSKAIMKLLKRDDIAHELKLELIELLKELTIKVEKCDERDQYFFSEQHKKTMGYGTVALFTVAAIYGVVTSKKS